VLAQHFLDRFRAEHRRAKVELSPEAILRLNSWSWPGNVRELEHCIERAVLLASGPVIRPEDLGLSAARKSRGEADGEAVAGASGDHAGDLAVLLRSLFDSTRPFTLREALAIPERELLRLALELQGGHRQATARMLGVNRSTLFNKMRRYGLLGHPRRASDGTTGASEDAANGRTKAIADGGEDSGTGAG